MKQDGKPRGYFRYLLAADCETTGLCFKNYDNDENVVFNETTGERHQAISWGIMIVDADTLEPVEELYLEVKWNDESKRQKERNSAFGDGAAKIHGLTRAHLEEHGVTEEEAVMQIGALITKYFGVDNAIKFLGHNSHLFDIAFMRDLFKRHGINLKFGSRHFDTNSISFATVGAWNSDDMFNTIGYQPRGEHNALDDVKMTLEFLKVVRGLWKAKVGLMAYPD